MEVALGLILTIGGLFGSVSQPSSEHRPLWVVFCLLMVVIGVAILGQALR